MGSSPPRIKKTVGHRPNRRRISLDSRSTQPARLLKTAQRGAIEICILAGGQSARMGRDKSKLRLGSASMIQRIRATARKTGFRVRVLRKDEIPNCGPLGGIHTALARSNAQATLFLACDMPFISTSLLNALLQKSDAGNRPVFVCSVKIGFPFILPQIFSSVVLDQIRSGRFSLQCLATKTGALILRVNAASPELLNVNTPADLARARRNQLVTAALHG